MNKTIITITGPSGSGKTELLNALLRTGKFVRLLSATTRPMRTGETNGVDYRFISEDKFKELLSQNEFVQHVHFQGLQYYGTLKSDAELATHTGKIALSIVEPTGISQFQKFANENHFRFLTIFLDADFQVLVHRYLLRLCQDDLTDTYRALYHSKRIAAIHEEHTTWRDAASYNCKFINSGDNLQYIEEMADILCTYIKE